MTSRDSSEMRCQGHLDAMIRWTLRDSAAGASPPPSTWSEISERVRGQPERSRQARRRELRLGFRWAAQCFLQLTAGPTNPLTYAGGADHGNIRAKYDLCLLRYQPDLMMLLGQVL